MIKHLDVYSIAPWQQFPSNYGNKQICFSAPCAGEL